VGFFPRQPAVWNKRVAPGARFYGPTFAGPPLRRERDQWSSPETLVGERLDVWARERLVSQIVVSGPDVFSFNYHVRVGHGLRCW